MDCIAAARASTRCFPFDLVTRTASVLEVVTSQTDLIYFILPYLFTYFIKIMYAM